jgi:integrase
MRRTHAGHRAPIPLAKIRLDDKTVRALESPNQGNRIDYDLPSDSGRGDFVRGFAVRTTAAGLKTFLLVYVTQDGTERRHVIGNLGPHTVTTAREAARKLRNRVDAGGDPYAEQKSARTHADAKRARAGATLGRMCEGYVAALRDEGKPSATKVEASLRLHLQEPFPALWKTPAMDVTLDELVRVTNRLSKAGKQREAGKVRAYLRAAFAVAIGARGNAATAHHFEGFNLTTNPVRDLAPIRAKKAADARPKKRALSLSELRDYWHAINALPAPDGPLLRFHLLTGAQRVEQLARLTTAHYDADTHAITLWDTKGRRTEARRHIVPLTKEAEMALAAITPKKRKGDFLLSITAGEQPAGYHVVWERVQRVAEGLVAAEKLERVFTPGELRKTVETRLAAAGVSKEVRAHLQSHGLSGVQDTHYDDHDYLDEKRAALDRLRSLLEPESKVVPMRRKVSGASR